MKYVTMALLVIIMIAIPYNIHGPAKYLFYILGGIAILSVKFRTSNLEFLIIALSLCLPYGFSSTGESFENISSIKKAFSTTVFIFLPIGYLYLYLNKHVIKEKNYNTLAVLMLFLGIFVSFLHFETNEFRSLWHRLCCCFFFMSICYSSKKGLIEKFLIFDVLFLITGIYGLMDYFFHNSPYQFITERIVDISSIGRARGILGHPLYLSGVGLLYQSLLFIRFIIYKKYPFAQQFFCLFVLLITVSRTTLICLIFESLVFILLTSSYKNLRKSILFIGGTFIFASVIYYLAYIFHTH